MSHDYRADAAAYALGALESDARRAFETQLAADPECQRDVDAYRQVAGLLALSAPAIAPRDAAALRARVLSSAHERRPELSVATTSRGPRRATPSNAERDTASASGRSRLPWLAAAASLTIAVAAASGYFGASAERARLAHTVEQMRADEARTRQALASRDSILSAFMGPMVHVVSLSPDASSAPTARVFWNHTKNTFIVTAFNVPRAPQGKTYQLWAIRKGKPTLSMGTFDVDASGRALAIVPVGVIADAGRIDGCAMTLEPSGGSAQPTETPRLVGSWRHVD